jgi:hypothetical protein
MLALILGTCLAHAVSGAEVAAQLESLKAHRGIETAPQIPASAYQQALDGRIAKGIEVVENIKAAKGYGVAVFDIPIAELWKAIADESHHAGATSVSISEVISGNPRTHDHVIFQYLDIPMLSDRWTPPPLDGSGSSPGRTRTPTLPWSARWTSRSLMMPSQWPGPRVLGCSWTCRMGEP